MPDQKAERIVQILKDEVFTVVGPPDQGHNFESRLLNDLCSAFGVKKSHTIPYHPMGDGLVERMNRSLLSLLRTYVERENLWEEHLQLLFIELLSILQLDSLPLRCCLAPTLRSCRYQTCSGFFLNVLIA